MLRSNQVLIYDPRRVPKGRSASHGPICRIPPWRAHIRCSGLYGGSAGFIQKL